MSYQRRFHGTTGGVKSLTSRKRKRVLLAKPMLDGHDRGIKLVAKGLKDAGVEVIYLGLLQTPEEIVEAAIQEDVDVVGLGTSMGIHKTVFSDTIDQLRIKDCGKIKVIGGGSIPQRDVPALKEMGVDEIFGPGSLIGDIVDYVFGLP
jgi:methylmalonyl-CoA mutase C-terminal domain/subunit